MVVIEINPRTSRSSALASKATGFPIAMVSSLLAGGLTLDEIPYWRDGTLEKYTPSGRLRGGQVRPLGLREVPGRRGPAGDADAGRGRGHVHRQELQGVPAEGYPLSGDRPPRLGLRQGLQQPFPRGAPGPARGAHQRAAVHHVRGPAQGGYDREPVRPHVHQTLVHRADAGVGGTRGGDPRLAVAGASGRRAGSPRPRGLSGLRGLDPRRAAGPGEEGRFLRRLLGEASCDPRGPDPRPTSLPRPRGTATTPSR